MEGVPGFDRLTTAAVAGHAIQEEKKEMEKKIDDQIERKKMKEKKDPKLPSMAALKGAAKQDELMKEIVSKEDKKEYNRKRMQIQIKVENLLNNRILGPHLKGIKAPPSSASLEDFEYTLNLIQNRLGSRDAVKTLWFYIHSIMDMVVAFNIQKPEYWGDINLAYPKNLSTELKSDKVREELAETIEEFAIMYDNWLTQSVETRLVFGLISVAMAVARENRNPTDPSLREEVFQPPPGFDPTINVFGPPIEIKQERKDLSAENENVIRKRGKSASKGISFKK